jgi:hypothetical protein
MFGMKNAVDDADEDRDPAPDAVDQDVLDEVNLPSGDWKIDIGTAPKKGSARTSSRGSC